MFDGINAYAFHPLTILFITTFDQPRNLDCEISFVFIYLLLQYEHHCFFYNFSSSLFMIIL